MPDEKPMGSTGSEFSSSSTDARGSMAALVSIKERIERMQLMLFQVRNSIVRGHRLSYVETPERELMLEHLKAATNGFREIEDWIEDKIQAEQDKQDERRNGRG